MSEAPQFSRGQRVKGRRSGRVYMVTGVLPDAVMVRSPHWKYPQPMKAEQLSPLEDGDEIITRSVGGFSVEFVRDQTEEREEKSMTPGKREVVPDDGTGNAVVQGALAMALQLANRGTVEFEAGHLIWHLPFMASPYRITVEQVTDE